MALSPREDGPVSPYRTFIALWQGFDERIEAHQAGRRFYLAHVNIAKACDVLRQSAIQQFHALWQITNVRPQFKLVPGKHVGTIQADFATQSRPEAHQKARQGGFS